MPRVLNIYAFSVVLILNNITFLFCLFLFTKSRYFIRLGSVVMTACLKHPSQAILLEDELYVVFHGLYKKAT